MGGCERCTGDKGPAMSIVWELPSWPAWYSAQSKGLAYSSLSLPFNRPSFFLFFLPLSPHYFNMFPLSSELENILELWKMRGCGPQAWLVFHGDVSWMLRSRDEGWSRQMCPGYAFKETQSRDSAQMCVQSFNTYWLSAQCTPLTAQQTHSKYRKTVGNIESHCAFWRREEIMK